MIVLSSSYVIIMNCAINAPGHEKNLVDVLNATDKLYFKSQMELIGKLRINNTKISECFPVLQNIYPLNLQINVYIF